MGIIESKDVLIKYKNGDIYKGSIQNFKPHGKGKLQLFDGKIEEGIFENGIFIDS